MITVTDRAAKKITDLGVEALRVSVKKTGCNGYAYVFKEHQLTSDEVYYDFHAEPAKAPEGYFVRYAEGESMKDSGSLVAPFTGHHGWYWLNISEKPVTINLQVDGYHKELIEVFRNKR